MSTRRLRYEVALVLALTFGMAGLRSIFTLIDALSTPLNTQSVTLNAPRATAAWLDFALQLCGAATIMTWGLLALFLLGERLENLEAPTLAGVWAWPPSSESQVWASTMRRFTSG